MQQISIHPSQMERSILRPPCLFWLFILLWVRIHLLLHGLLINIEVLQARRQVIERSHTTLTQRRHLPHVQHRDGRVLTAQLAVARHRSRRHREPRVARPIHQLEDRGRRLVFFSRFGA